MLRVVQTYHGNGGKEGYKFEVEYYVQELDGYVYLGELENFPQDELIVELNGSLYRVVREYDVNETKEDEELEKVIIELEPYIVLEPSYPVLEWKIFGDL